MVRPKFICLKRAVIGFIASCLAVTVTVWALQTYAPQASHTAIAIGAAFATFYCMTLAMRTAVQEAHRAGEVGRRLPARRTPRAIESKPAAGHPGIAARTVFSASGDSEERFPVESVVAAGHVHGESGSEATAAIESGDAR